MSSKVLSIDLITASDETQGRAAIDDDHVADLVAAWLAKSDIPPLTVYFDGSEYHLSDGFHRLAAARIAKRSSVPVDLKPGSKRDAWKAALQANQGHGLRRSNADKRRLVTLALNDDELVKWSDNRVAEHIGVSQEMVRQTRAQLTTVVSSPAAKTKDEPKIGKDGKSRKAPKASTKKPKPKAPPVTETDGECPPGDHVWIEDNADEYCEKCKVGRKDIEPVTNGPLDFPTEILDKQLAADKTGELDLTKLQAKYDTMLNAITQITKIWNEVCADDRDGVYAAPKKQRVISALGELRPPIAQARPMKVCTFCKGNGCQKCSGCGWWPRSVVEGLSR